jgi:hypothetical protein
MLTVIAAAENRIVWRIAEFRKINFLEEPSLSSSVRTFFLFEHETVRFYARRGKTICPKFSLIGVATPLPACQGRRPSGAVVAWVTLVNVAVPNPDNWVHFLQLPVLSIFDLPNAMIILQPTTVHQQLLWPPHSFHSIPVCCHGNGSLSTHARPGSNVSSAINFRGLKSKNIPQPTTFRGQKLPEGPQNQVMRAWLEVTMMSDASWKEKKGSTRTLCHVKRLSGVRGNSLTFCRGRLRNINAIFHWSF